MIVNANNSNNKKLLIRVFICSSQISNLNSNVVDFILNKLSRIFYLIDVDVVESSIWLFERCFCFFHASQYWIRRQIQSKQMNQSSKDNSSFVHLFHRWFLLHFKAKNVLRSSIIQMNENHKNVSLSFKKFQVVISKSFKQSFNDWKNVISEKNVRQHDIQNQSQSSSLRFLFNNVLMWSQRKKTIETLFFLFLEKIWRFNSSTIHVTVECLRTLFICWKKKVTSVLQLCLRRN